MHYAEITLEKCDTPKIPDLIGDAASEVAAFHSAFRAKCAADLMGDSFSGVFTGTFDRRWIRLFGWSKPEIMPVFIIKEVSPDALDSTKVPCFG